MSAVLASAQTRPGDSAVATASLTCSDTDPNTVDFTARLPWQRENCIKAVGGFTSDAGSFARLAVLADDFLHTAGTFSVSVEQGERLRNAQIGFAKKSLFGTPIEGGLAIYGQRFKYNQARDSSLFAFQPDIPAFLDFSPDDLVKYVKHSYGATVFARYRPGRFSSFGISYGYDVSDVKPLTAGTNDYFSSLRFQSVSGPYPLNGIRTSKVTASFTYNTVNNPVQPSRGGVLLVSTAIAGLGGNVNTFEPVVDAKLFYRGVMRKHVIGIHLRGSMIMGYAGKEAPPFDRYYSGGEDEVRGFDSWSISPVAVLPSSVNLNQLNPDGSVRLQNELVNGKVITVPITLPIPIYRLISPGGDEKFITNVEYRIPLGGPFTLVFFDDTGTNRLTSLNPLQPIASRFISLSTSFPQAEFTDDASAANATESIRMSTGVELQFLLKRLQTPLRFYWAYNPLIVQGYLQPRIVFDRATFPNAATFNEALEEFGAPTPLVERRNMFRFSIGRTF